MTPARAPWWPVALWAVLLIGLIAGVGQFAWTMSDSAAARIAAIEPRYARLAGLGEDRGRLLEVAAQASRAVSRHAYPAARDVSQAGNDAQQRVREAFAKGGLEVVSIQVLPARTAGRFDRIPISLRVDGEFAALQATLTALPGLAPSVFVEGFSVTGSSGNAPETAPLRTVAELQLYALRVRP